MNKIPHPGLPAILEVYKSDIDRIKPLFKSHDSRERLSRTITNYLLQNIPFEEALNIFTEECGHTETVYKLREIVEVDPNPIPSDDDPEAAHKKSRSWSQNEDIRLLAGIYRYGLDNWSSIAVFVGNNRTRAQCAQRWSRGLNPRISKDSWTHEDETKLINYVNQFGEKSWTKIAALIGNRSDVQCRYHYNQITKNGKQLLISPINTLSPAMTPAIAVTTIPGVPAVSPGISTHLGFSPAISITTPGGYINQPIAVISPSPAPVRIPMRFSMPNMSTKIVPTKANDENGNQKSKPCHEERRSSMFTPHQHMNIPTTHKVKIDTEILHQNPQKAQMPSITETDDNLPSTFSGLPFTSSNNNTLVMKQSIDGFLQRFL
ncbi:Myb-like DNA-binding domain containing protein [Tritrichomonas foetus]|uniref:Myb-like DNA-binding domain containing protein n=1 Tax=Tritrichomonas foetus TaxID=1144522 RepID=A0A1J4J0L8_9EUKA|nr:Myb-like DNA-binding domain containing protein [Tritrichomonas foetus]|eukprot:OHS93120.1 Myb-like DNA-binding domain containing protein [Tritrichomonas foetus]